MSDMDRIRKEAAEQARADEAAGKAQISAQAAENAEQSREDAEAELRKVAKHHVATEEAAQAGLDDAAEAEKETAKTADEDQRAADKAAPAAKPEHGPGRAHP